MLSITRYPLAADNSYFVDVNAVDEEHKFSLDDVFLGAIAFGIFYNCLAGFEVGVDKVGDVPAGAFKKHASLFSFMASVAVGVLCRDEYERYLLAEVGNETGTQ